MIRRLRTLWRVGAHRQPLEALAHQVRHRKLYAAFEQASLGQRYLLAVLLAKKVGLLDALADGGDVDGLAARTRVDPRGVASLVRILESEGWAVRAGARWSLSEFASGFLTGPTSGAQMLDLLVVNASSFDHVVTGLVTGAVPPGLDVRDASGGYRAFLIAVNGYLHWAVRELVGRVEWPDVQRILVGSMGVSSSAVWLERFPDSRVTYACLDHLVAEIPALRERFGVPAARVDATHMHAGEPEDDEWGGPFDLILLTRKMILAPDERVGERFARKAASALRPGGALVLWEVVYEDGPTPLPRALEAVWDVCASPTAPPRTRADFERMLGGMGFARVEVVPCLEGQTTFVVARKP